MSGERHATEVETFKTLPDHKRQRRLSLGAVVIVSIDRRYETRN